MWSSADATFLMDGCSFLLHIRLKGGSLLHLPRFLLQVPVLAANNLERPPVHNWALQVVWGLALDVRARSMLPHEPARNFTPENSLPLADVRLLRDTWSWPALPFVRQNHRLWEPWNPAHYGCRHLRVPRQFDLELSKLGRVRRVIRRPKPDKSYAYYLALPVCDRH